MFTFTTEDGAEIHYKPVSSGVVDLVRGTVMAEYKARGEMIEPPMYEFQTVGGALVHERHNETTLTTDEDRRLWSIYQATLERMNKEVQKRSTWQWLIRGVILPEGTDLEAWAAQQKSEYGLDVPEGYERKYHYITTELTPSPADTIRLIGEIQKASLKSVVDGSKIDAAIDGFLHQLSAPQPEKAADPTQGAAL